jgi:hypothetical protein
MMLIPATAEAGRLLLRLPGLARWGLLACELVEAD